MPHAATRRGRDSASCTTATMAMTVTSAMVRSSSSQPLNCSVNVDTARLSFIAAGTTS